MIRSVFYDGYVVDMFWLCWFFMKIIRSMHILNIFYIPKAPRGHKLMENHSLCTLTASDSFNFSSRPAPRR